MPQDQLKNVPIGVVQEFMAGIDIEKAQYQNRNTEDQYITTVTKGGRLRLKKKKIKGHKPNSSHLVRVNLPDLQYMKQIRPFSEDENWCPIPRVFCKKMFYSIDSAVNKDSIDMITDDLLTMFDKRHEICIQLYMTINSLLTVDNHPFIWNPFPNIPMTIHYFLYWLLVFRVSMLEYISHRLNTLCYQKTSDYETMFTEVESQYVANIVEEDINTNNNIFYSTHVKTIQEIDLILKTVLDIDLSTIVVNFESEDLVKDHSFYSDNDNYELWRFRELQYNITLLLNTHIPVITHIGKLIQYEMDKQNESSSMVRLGGSIIDYSQYIGLWLESSDFIDFCIKTWYNEKEVLHEGSLYDISSFLIKTKICGDQDNDKIKIVKLLNKIMPIKCMSRNLGSILVKSVTTNQTIYDVVYRMIQCTVLNLYRRNQSIRYSLSVRIKMFSEFISNYMDVTTFTELYGKESNSRFPLVKFAMKENVIFMTKLIPGIRDKLDSEFNDIWKRFEYIVIDHIDRMKICIELCGTKKNFLDSVHEIFEQHVIQQKDIIYRPHKRNLLTVIVSIVDTILVEYYAEILLKGVLGVKPSKTVIGLIGVDRDNDCIVDPTVEQVCGIDRLSDVYEYIEEVFENFTYTNTVSITSLEMFGISEKTIQKLALMISEYEVQPMETQVERTLKSVLYDPIRARWEFPEREFLVIRKYFHVMNHIVTVRPISLPKHYRDNQVIALKRRYRIYDGSISSETIDDTIGSILYCKNCNNIRSPVTTDINNNFNDYGNFMEITDILETSKNDKNILCYCRPRTHIKQLEQKLTKTNSMIHDAFQSRKKDNIIKNFDLQNIGDFDELGNMTITGIYKKKEKKEKNRGKHMTIHPIERLFKTKANIEFSLWKHKQCTKTPIKRLPIIGKGIFINNIMYIICPRCGVYTIYTAERLRGGFVTCGVCDKMLSDIMMKKIVSNNTAIMSNTYAIINKLNIINIDSENIIDDIMMDVYNNRIKCIYGCSYNNNVNGWTIIQVIDDENILVNIDFVRTYNHHDQNYPILNIYLCKKHCRPFCTKYCDIVKELYNINPDNFRYPMLSILMRSINEQWSKCELDTGLLIEDSTVTININTETEPQDDNKTLLYGPIIIHTNNSNNNNNDTTTGSSLLIIDNEQHIPKKRGRKPKFNI